MSTQWGSAEVKCPFYNSHNSNSISCESLLCGKGRLTHSFFVKTDQQRHMRRCCCSQYRKCLYYRMLIEMKYSENPSRG